MGDTLEEIISTEIKNEANTITCYMDYISLLSDDEDKEYVLNQLKNIREQLRELASIIEFMDMKI